MQRLNIGAGVQDRYDPWRTAIAGGTGFVTGATGKALAEAFSPARFYDPRRTKVEQLTVNAYVGRSWESQTRDDLQRMGLQKISGQVTVMPPGGPSVRVDFVAWDPQLEKWRCFECKSSMTARDTGRQKKAFPKIEQYGGEVRGAGKSDLPGGTWIPATEIEYLRRGE